MKQEKTKEQVLKTLAACYAKAETPGEFFNMLNLQGVKTYEQDGQVEGILIDGTNVSLASLGYPHEALQSLDPLALTDEDLALIEQIRAQIDTGERRENELRASDIVPDFKQLEEELGTERSDERQDELDAIRGGQGEEKELGDGPER